MLRSGRCGIWGSLPTSSRVRHSSSTAKKYLLLEARRRITARRSKREIQLMFQENNKAVKNHCHKDAWGMRNHSRSIRVWAYQLDKNTALLDVICFLQVRVLTTKKILANQRLQNSTPDGALPHVLPFACAQAPTASYFTAKRLESVGWTTQNKASRERPYCIANGKRWHHPSLRFVLIVFGKPSISSKLLEDFRSGSKS